MGIQTFYCREHPIQCDADRIREMDQEAWEALMRAKYPEYSGDFDEFTAADTNRI